MSDPVPGREESTFMIRDYPAALVQGAARFGATQERRKRWPRRRGCTDMAEGRSWRAAVETVEGSLGWRCSARSRDSRTSSVFPERSWS